MIKLFKKEGKMKFKIFLKVLAENLFGIFFIEDARKKKMFFQAQKKMKERRDRVLKLNEELLWESSFTEERIGGKKLLIFWFNDMSGSTHTITKNY